MQTIKTSVSTIVRLVTVNPTLTAMQAVILTDRTRHIDEKVVESMPSCVGGPVEVHLVPLKEDVKARELEDHLSNLGYKMIGPIAACALNETDRHLAEHHRNGVQWKNADGEHCFLAFKHDDGRQEDLVIAQKDGQGDNTDWKTGWFIPCTLV